MVSSNLPAKAVFRAVMADSPEQLRELVQSGAPVSGPTAINAAGKSPKEVARNRSKVLALAYLEEAFELTVSSVTDGTGFQVEGLTLDTTVPQLRAKVAELWRAGLVAGLAADWARGVAKSARLARARVVRSGRNATDPRRLGRPAGSDRSLQAIQGIFACETTENIDFFAKA